MKVIDMHIHVFPDDVADDYIENYSQHSKLKAVCRPTLTDLYKEYKDFDVLKYVILQEWESTKQFDSENLRFSAESDRYYAKCYFYTYNQWLGKIQRENDNLICFGGIHPDDPDCLTEFEKMEKEYGLSGMKLVPCMQHFFLNDKRLFPVYEKAAASGMPILAHTGGDPLPGRELYGHPRDVDEIASTFPDLTIIMAHMGIPFFEETKAILRKHNNVFTDIAFSVVYDDVLSFSERHDIDASFLTHAFWNETLSSLIKDFGYEKVLFGSDFPFVKPSRAIKAFLDLDISDDGKEKILWKKCK